MTTYIYILRDPRDMAIKYVGKTLKPRARYAHLQREAEGDTHKARWFRCLLRKGLKPVIEIVQKVEGDGWAEVERHWIKKLRDEGHPLTNGSMGGEGEPGFNHSQASCIKRALKLKGHPVHPETRIKLREAGHKQWASWTPEQRAEHARKSTRPHTPEEIERQRIAQTGKRKPSHSEQTRHAISERLKAKYQAGELPRTPAQQAAAVRLGESGRHSRFTLGHKRTPCTSNPAQKWLLAVHANRRYRARKTALQRGATVPEWAATRR